jgi:hypothetical protein
VLNKVDLVANPSFTIEDERIVRVFQVSCATGIGIGELKRALFELCPPALPVKSGKGDDLVDFLVYRPRVDSRRYRVLRTDRGFRIAGRPPEDEAELGAALRAAGARSGDMVELDGDELELA